MTIKEYNRLVEYLISDQKIQPPAKEKKKFEQFINANPNSIYSKLFFEYSQLEIAEEDAREFFKNTIQSKARLEDKLSQELDFRVVFLDYLIRNISQIHQATEPRIIEEKIFMNLNKLILKDELTGLYNYRHYEKQLQKEFALALRHSHSFCLIIFDLDDFKYYNDTYGHDQGNVVLRRVAKIIGENARSSDIVCRYGGEEFALILPQTEKNGALVLAEKIRKAVAMEEFVEQVTISGGIAGFPNDTQQRNRTLFSLADKALYKSKEMGKNRITLYSKEIKNSAVKV
ncbi:MAG: GGDEF domain-containing protein [Spirochaetales bacterium]|nr:GGDEF domain-containing protein [Spirochaetales bacterium]